MDSHPPRVSLYRRLHPLIGIVSTCVFALPAPAQTPPSTASIVRFNTVCATCHEAECSSRLSFRLDPGATDSHIRRYTGDIATESARELAALLEHMKLNCGYHDIRIPVPADRKWRAELLAQLHAAQDNAYFLPLGPLTAGRHRFSLAFDRETTVSIQLISATFEIEELPSVQTTAGQASVVLEAAKAGAHYLRLRTDHPARLLALEQEPPQ
jgi:hypothetical protein